jgi:hypothetical protein
MIKNYKVGDQVKLKQDSKTYTGKYAGTTVCIDEICLNYCNVLGFDGKKFMLPYSYIDDDLFEDDDIPPPVPKSSKCTCGAHKVYGEDCPDFYHYDFCPLYRPKEGKR